MSSSARVNRLHAVAETDAAAASAVENCWPLLNWLCVQLGTEVVPGMVVTVMAYGSHDDAPQRRHIARGLVHHLVQEVLNIR